MLRGERKIADGGAEGKGGRWRGGGARVKVLRKMRVKQADAGEADGQPRANTFRVEEMAGTEPS
jgi:hypothetical protein